MRIFLILSLLLFLPACRTIPDKTAQNVNKREFAKGDSRLKTVGEKILTSLQNNDYREFAKYVNDKENKISEEEFQVSEKNIREQFGTIKGFEYLSDLEMPLVHNMIWKVQFERKGKNQETVKQDLLFRLVLGTIDGKPHIISMGFL